MKKKNIFGGLFKIMMLAGLIINTLIPTAFAEEEETILIGANYEQTGAGAAYGYPALRSLELAAEEINEKGGLLGGKKIEIITADNKSDKTETVTVAEDLISKGAVAILGPGITGDVQAQKPLIENYNIPNILPMATGDGITLNEKGEVIDYLFRVCFEDSYQGLAAGKFVSEELGAKKAALIIDNSLDYAIGLADAFKEEFEKRGGEIIYEDYFQGGQTDFMTIITTLQAYDYDVIYAPGYYDEIGPFIKQARGMGIDKPIVGGDGYSSQVLIDLAEAENATDIYFTSHFSENDPNPKIQDFKKAFEDKFDLPIDTFSALGYDAAYLLFDAIERAGSTDPEAIRQALIDTESFEGVTGTFSFDDNHNPIKPALMLKLENGEVTETFEVQVD